MERNKILLVDPECNCRLVDLDSGVYSWLIQFNKPLVYEYRQPQAKDYLTIVQSKHGTLNLIRHRLNTKGEELSSEPVCCGKEQDRHMLLNGEKCLTSTERVYVNGTTGEIGQKSEDAVLIVRSDYQMKSYSRRSLENRLSWHINFSRFEAFYPSKKEFPDPMKVFHTVNQQQFYEFCKKFDLKNQYKTPLLENIRWNLPRKEEKDGIQMSESYVHNSNMRRGSFLGVEVGVEKLKAKGTFSERVKILTNLGAHENILVLIAAETDGISDTFAYQMTFTLSLKTYLPLASFRKTNPKWLKVFRGIICGLQYLHTHKLRHGKLNMDNVFVKVNHTSKLAGLAEIEVLSHEERRGDLTEYISKDIFDFGKLLLNVVTEGKHGGDPTWGKHGGDATWETELEEILKNLAVVDEEVKDLLRKVLKRNYKDRPTLQQILEHPFFCDLQGRIELLSQLSDFCEAKKMKADKFSKKTRKKHGDHRVVRELDTVKGPKLFGRGLNWKHIFDNEAALAKAMKYRTSDYDYTKLTDLIRLFRNIMTHHSEYKEKFKLSLGATKSHTEAIFRQKFPEYFMAIHEVAKRHLKQKFKSILEFTDPDFTFKQTIPLSVCSRR